MLVGVHPAYAALAVLGTVVTAGAWRWIAFVRCARIGDRLADSAVAFECSAGEDAPRVLVIGDSTGVGTGAERIRGYLQQHPLSLDRRSLSGRVALDRRTQQLVDVLADPEFGRQDLQELFGFRTSLAAPSGSRVVLKRTVIWLRSARLIELMYSMPSMPESDSSSTCVTWLSTMLAEAPVKVVSTVTTGSSMFGYSRTVSRS